MPRIANAVQMMKWDTAGLIVTHSERAYHVGIWAESHSVTLSLLNDAKSKQSYK